MSTGAQAGIGVGVGVFGLVVLGLAVWSFLRWRRKRERTSLAGTKVELPDAEDWESRKKEALGSKNRGSSGGGELEGARHGAELPGEQPAEVDAGPHGAELSAGLENELPGDFHPSEVADTGVSPAGGEWEKSA